MRNPIRNLAAGERGFTLIELLAVILIIGILTAIALPQFLPFQSKAKDAGAKSNARNAMTHVEACQAAEQTYQNCTSAAQLGTTGLTIVNSAPANGEVKLSAGSASTYQIVAASEASNLYTITKSSNGALSRTCSLGSGQTVSGCPSSGSW